MIVFIRQLLSGLIILLIVSSCSKEKSKKNFTIARKATWEGVNLHGTEKKIQGFTNDLLFEIAHIEKAQFNIKSVETRGSLIPFLEDPTIDAVLSVLEPTPVALKNYVFSEPFFTFGPVFVTKTSATIASLDDLKEKIVGFERGLNVGYLRNDLQTVFRPYDQPTVAIEDLLTGNIDALVLDSVYAYQLASGIYAGKIIICPLRLPLIQFRAVVKKGVNEAFITIFNDGLKKIKESDTYENMLKYWEIYGPH